MEVGERNRAYKEAIGSFVIAFSQVEYGLAFLCSMSDFDLSKRDENLFKYVGFGFQQKMDHLNSFINDRMPEIVSTWNELRPVLNLINSERRYLVHGIPQYFIPNEFIRTIIKGKRGMIFKTFTLEEIKKLTNSLHELNTGKNGISGEFYLQFTRIRIDQWNDLVNDNFKMKYEVNGKILSKWKGRGKK